MSNPFPSVFPASTLSRGPRGARRKVNAETNAPSSWSEQDFDELEKEYSDGISVPQIVQLFVDHGERLTESTFRKYVQLGLLPKSVRVRLKGKQRGSYGLYPASVVRQIQAIRALMAKGCTMEEIQREFLFARGDIEALQRQLQHVYGAFDTALEKEVETRSAEAAAALRQELERLRTEGRTLIAKLEALERRLAMRAKMQRAAV